MGLCSIKQFGHKSFATLNLLEHDELVGTMCLADIAGSADHGMYTGALKLSRFRRITKFARLPIRG